MSLSEEELVRASQGGNRAAFEELVRRLGRLVFAQMYAETRDRSQVEDLVQETFLRAWRGVARLEEPGGFRAWLRTVAHNVAIDAGRRVGREQRAGLSPAVVGRIGVPDAAGCLPADPPASGTSEPARAAAVGEERARVLAALETLPEEHRDALRLRYLAGADYATIVRQMGITEGAVRGILHRGLGMLRERMEENARREMEAAKLRAQT